MLGDEIWVLATNLVVWTGLFLYVLRLHRKVAALERQSLDTEREGDS